VVMRCLEYSHLSSIVDSKVLRGFDVSVELLINITQHPAWVDGVVGKCVCLTGLILGQTEGPQFEPELMHKVDI